MVPEEMVVRARLGDWNSSKRSDAFRVVCPSGDGGSVQLLHAHGQAVAGGLAGFVPAVPALGRRVCYLSSLRGQHAWPGCSRPGDDD